MQADQAAVEAEARARLKRLTPKDLARQTGRDLVVPEDSTLVLSPSSDEFSHAFARVTVTSFEDAQIMGFIPRKLSEEKVLRAIRDDDALAYKMASRGLSSRGGCGCGHEGESGVASLRGNYSAIRTRNNPALADLLSDGTGARIAWDSPIAASTRKWALMSRAAIDIITALFADITVNRNATLEVASSTRSLWAHDIWIHRSGKLVQKGSYLRIWANSMNSFAGVIDTGLVVELKKFGIPWHLDK